MDYFIKIIEVDGVRRMVVMPEITIISDDRKFNWDISSDTSLNPVESETLPRLEGD